MRIARHRADARISGLSWTHCDWSQARLFRFFRRGVSGQSCTNLRAITSGQRENGRHVRTLYNYFARLLVYLQGFSCFFSPLSTNTHHIINRWIHILNKVPKRAARETRAALSLNYALDVTVVFPAFTTMPSLSTSTITISLPVAAVILLVPSQSVQSLSQYSPKAGRLTAAPVLYL